MSEGAQKFAEMFFGLKMGQAMVYAGIAIAFASAFQFSGSVGDYVQFEMTEAGSTRLDRLTWMIILLGVGLQFYRTHAESKAKERSEARAEQRSRSRDRFEPSARLVAFANEVLHTPMDRKTLAEAQFTGYAGYGEDELRAVLMQATADQCVITGLATRKDGVYTSSSDRTVMI